MGWRREEHAEVTGSSRGARAGRGRLRRVEDEPPVAQRRPAGAQAGWRGAGAATEVRPRADRAVGVEDHRGVWPVAAAVGAPGGRRQLDDEAAAARRVERGGAEADLAGGDAKRCGPVQRDRAAERALGERERRQRQHVAQLSVVGRRRRALRLAPPARVAARHAQHDTLNHGPGVVGRAARAALQPPHACE